MTKLNKNQIKAVKHKSGPLLIIAGAGTGKTTVIVERIKYLISQNLAKPEEILALTFTEKAASEMQERVDIALPLGYADMDIDTFHGFCDKILRQYAIHVGLDPNYKLLTNARQIDLFRKNLFKFDLSYFRPLGNPNKFIHGMLTHFSRLADEDVTPDEYLKWSKKQNNDMTNELASTYKAWDELKIKNSFLDFSDLISKTLLLFRKRKNVLEEIRNKYKYILIDEFQDTNFAQNELANLIINSKQNITVVGDDDQSIYKFRGAAVSNILSFRKTFPKSKLIVLNKNYRSKQKILDASYKLIQNNNPDRLEIKEKINKKLISNKKGNTKVEFIHTKTGDKEARKVVEKIIKLSKRYNYNDFAILVRANNHADQFVRELNSKNIPHQFLGPEKLYLQEEVIDLISYLKVVYDTSDSLSLTRLLSIDEINITGSEITKILNKSKSKNEDLFDNLDNEIVEIISDHQERMHRESAGVLLYEFIEKTGILKNLLNIESETAVRRSQNISKFFERIKSFEIENGSALVREVVDWIELTTELGESPKAADLDWQTVDAVNILTVHSAKGLEFPVVFIVNLVNQRFPSMNRRDQIPIPETLIKDTLPEGDFHLEEERRLFYVALTRARDKVLLTAADYYGDAKRAKKISPFVYETLGKVDSSPQLVVKENKLVNVKKVAKLPSTNYQLLTVDTLSYSKIQTYQTCPLHYKLEYILNLPKKDSAALTMGNSIHGTLKNFYENKKFTKKKLIKLLNKNWENKGFESKKHEELMKKRAEKYLTKFFESRFDSNNLPIKLEERFSIKLPPPAADKLNKNKKPLKITGVIDRIDKINENTLEIIDYKTGENVPTQKQVDKNLQLTIYALAAKYSSDKIFRNVKKINLSLYYFEEDTWITTTRTERDLKNVVNEIHEIRNQIEESDFKCSKHYFCQKGCEYTLYCNEE